MLSSSTSSFQALKNSSIKPKEHPGNLQINSDSKRTAKSQLTYKPLATPNSTAATLAAIPQSTETDADSSSEITTKRLQNGIKICNLPSGYDCWEVLELFSKVGTLNEYRCENTSMILIFRNSESVYLSRFFNNHQFGKLESLITLAPALAVQDVANKRFTPYMQLTNNLGINSNNNNNQEYNQRSVNSSLADLNDLPAMRGTASNNTNNKGNSMIRAASQTNIILTIPTTTTGTPATTNNFNQAVSSQQIGSQDIYSASFAVPASSQVSKSAANPEKQFLSRSVAHHSSMIPSSKIVSNRYESAINQSNNESYSTVAGTLKHSPNNNENNTNKRNNNLLNPKILTYSSASNGGGLLAKSKKEIEEEDALGGSTVIRTEKKQKGFRRGDLNASNVSSGSSQDQNLEKTRKKSRKSLEIYGEEEDGSEEDEDDMSSFNNTSNNRFSMKPTIILNSNEKDGLFSSNSKLNTLAAQPIQMESLSTEESLRKVLDEIELPSVYQKHEQHVSTPMNSNNNNNSKNTTSVYQSTPEEDIYAYFIMRQSYFGVLFLLYIAYLTFFYVL